MPYDTNADLPPAVRYALPPHAQDIYRAAFNSAWRRHMQPGSLEEATAHRIAWGAVKRQYQKLGSTWVPRAARLRLVSDRQGG